MDARRFLGASTHRGNWAHWRYASRDNINYALTADLPTLIQRCSFEYANNPLVYGAVETMANDMVGRNGPRLQVVSDNPQFNETVEQAWRRVWAMPDPNGQICGPESMRLWVRSLCTAGSFLNVFSDVKREGPVKFGWKTCDIRRLETPPGLAGDPLTAFGVTYTQSGRPRTYHLRRRAVTPHVGEHVDYQPIPADVVQHRFEFVEPEQLAGVPWLASCLETVADLADYDRFELDAAKLASQLSAIIQAASPELVVDPVNVLPGSTFQMSTGELTAIPAGWQALFPSANHPSGQYQIFRHERLRDLGLALGMPLMMVLLSSAESNFASAHYDGAVYMRRIKARNAWFERTTLNQFIEQIVIELVLASVTVRPDEYSLRWTWELPPYVNPEKQRKADRMALEDGAMPLSEYCASLGFEFEDVVAARTRENEMLEAADLPRPPVNTGNGGSQPAEDQSEEMPSGSSNAGRDFAEV